MFNKIYKEEILRGFVLFYIKQLICSHHKGFYELCNLDSNNEWEESNNEWKRSKLSQVD